MYIGNYYADYPWGNNFDEFRLWTVALDVTKLEECYSIGITEAEEG
eukprot:CAMPEP_0201285210 /NCGR_PEP_ID=MMETSP1317-20130820/98789_1 /ASSEMBLY_ACC=CAM_ASM_000770 /TAXON_ID=187299 /ORGANISM="Undescribed Undescribed, Strain Undescribed" /LENGTH=45 /DNA_ID= /DNA_START= /DNA_END= /DNA_ORIENTATION=